MILTRAEKTYLSRRKCGLCDVPLWPMQCGSICGARECTPAELEARARRCLAERKPRKKEASNG